VAHILLTSVHQARRVPHLGILLIMCNLVSACKCDITLRGNVHHVTCILLQWGRTALHHAAIGGHVQVVETLIRLGADVNVLVIMCVMK